MTSSCRRRHLLGARHGAVCACIALGSAAGAQPLQAPSGGVTCVDLIDATARRVVEIDPCARPIAPLPVGPMPRRPAYPPRSSDDAHPMFWRFPVQPLGPFDAPRHGRR
jgi:hypothetical protein